MNMRAQFSGFVMVLILLMRSGVAQQSGPKSSAPPVSGNAPQGSQPPPFTVPNPPAPGVTQAPGQQPAPEQQQPEAMPNAPLPQPDKSSVDLRQLGPLAAQPPSAAPSRAIDQSASGEAKPAAETPALRKAGLLNFFTPYHPVNVPVFPAGSPLAIDNFVRDGKLYLSLHDAIALTLANNPDIEVSRYDLLLADTDLTRAKGGGNLRGLDYTINQTPPGVGSITSPLLITASTTGSASPSSVNVMDLSQITQAGNTTPQSLSENDSMAFSAGPNLPLFDPVIIGQAAYFRRSDQTSLLTAGTGSTTGNPAGADQYLSTGLDYQQGFSPGGQLEVYADNAAQVLYGANSELDPFHSPSASATFTQPLLRGRGRAVNLRFIRIAQLDRKISRLLFEQQVLETVYGVSRIYYDLVSLGENIGVKQEALAAAQKLYDDDRNQVDEGTLAPIELTRVQALLSSSRLDLIQAEGEYRQQEVILREQLLRTLGTPAADFTTIVPTDTITVPDAAPDLDVSALIQDALANRPDLVQAALQIQADTISAAAARNGVKPTLNLYANAQTRGASLIPYEPVGSPGTGEANVPTALTQGGLRLSTIYQGGLELNLPLRNRIAEADAERDAIQLRQAQGRTLKLENDIRQQVENAAIALDTAHQAYAAAVESADYQQQLLQAEIDKFAVGESTNFLIVQDEAYLAQARSTEVAARSDWMKASLALDRSLGNLLEKNGLELEGVVQNNTK